MADEPHDTLTNRESSDLGHGPYRSRGPLSNSPKLERRGDGSKWTGRLIVLALIGGAIAFAPRALKKKPLMVKVAVVERATVRDEVSSSTAGEVVPARHATVRAELAARVMAVKKTRGDRARRGEVIVVLDAADLAARLEQAQATLEGQNAAVAQAEVRVQNANRAAERAAALALRGAGTTQLSEDSASAAREAKEAVRAAQSMLAQTEAAVRVARVARGKASLTAPFDGLLIDVHPDPGEELAPGTPVFEIIDDSRLHVEASIDEADVGKVQVNATALLKLDALPGKPIAGKVSKIGPAVRKDLKGARTLPIDVDVIDVRAATEAGLRSGMSANVEIRVAEKADVVSLPTNVIIGRGTKRTVFVVENGVAHVRNVEIGISNWDRSEVVSGVKVGDQIITTLNDKALEDGVAVQVEAK